MHGPDANWAFAIGNNDWSTIVEDPTVIDVLHPLFITEYELAIFPFTLFDGQLNLNLNPAAIKRYSKLHPNNAVYNQELSLL